MFDKLFLQRTYADQLASRIEGWAVQSYSPYRANFRCPICGDSQKNKRRKRGYIIENPGYLIYHCHNACGTIGFESYLKEHQSDLYAMYRLDLLKQMGASEENTYKKQEEAVTPYIELNDDIDLPIFTTNDSAYRYITSRKISEEFWDDIFYTEQFYKYVNTEVRGMFESSVADQIDERIVLPMRWFNGEVFGVIGRALKFDNPMRYLTIKFDDNKPKLFGLDRIDRFEDIYCLEGAIDSYFVDNSIAMAGTDGNPLEVFNKNQVVIALDNQPRDQFVLAKYEKYIEMGMRMVIWPNHIKGKDPNQMILNQEVTKKQLNKLVRDNTFDGVMLRIKFNSWRRN